MKRTIRSMNIALALIALSGSAFAIGGEPAAKQSTPDQTANGYMCRGSEKPGLGQQHGQQAIQPVIDVVFVLDTTGSMGGLIEGAKQKIWLIANQIAQAQPAPIVRMGLVGYRDRGDDYVTTVTALTEDIDTVYADLMAYKAQGGGDTPESVNEALFTAVERLDWTSQEGALKLIYLVGDAPPKMGYQDDVKYQASCKLAHEQGININAIQCGNLEGTQKFWQEISQLANGAYAKIEQSGGVVALSTPYDEQLAQLDIDMGATMLDYGNDKVRAYQSAKRDRSDGISAGASLEAAAGRAVYNYSASGKVNMLGKQELVDDVVNGDVDLDSVSKDHLPEELQSLSTEELKQEVLRRQGVREKITSQIKELAGKRAQFLKDNQPETQKDSFDKMVLEALVEQGARVGIEFSQESVPEAASETKSESIQSIRGCGG